MHSYSSKIFNPELFKIIIKFQKCFTPIARNRLIFLTKRKTKNCEHIFIGNILIESNQFYPKIPVACLFVKIITKKSNLIVG